MGCPGRASGGERRAELSGREMANATVAFELSGDEGSGATLMARNAPAGLVDAKLARALGF